MISNLAKRTTTKTISRKISSFQLKYFLRNRTSQQNLVLLKRLLFGLLSLLLLYGIFFHIFMYLEDREYSPINGLYWTLTTMSTLG